MAIVKFNNRKNSTVKSKRNKLMRGIKYITNLRKTSKDLIGGVGVDAYTAYERMKTIKKFYGKEGGREYIHFSVSFKGTKDYLSAFYCGEIIAQLFEGFQVLYAVHRNTANTHIHFIINSVCCNDGHKFSQSKADLAALKNAINGIVDRCGLCLEEISDMCDDYYEDYFDEEPQLIEGMIFYEDYGFIRPMIFDSSAKGDNG